MNKKVSKLEVTKFAILLIASLFTVGMMILFIVTKGFSGDVVSVLGGLLFFSPVTLLIGFLMRTAALELIFNN